MTKRTKGMTVKNPAHRSTLLACRVRPDCRVKFEELAVLEDCGPSTLMRLLIEEFVEVNEHRLKKRKRKRVLTTKKSRFTAKPRKRK